MKKFVFLIFLLSSLLFYNLTSVSSQIEPLEKNGTKTLKSNPFPCSLSDGCEESIIQTEPTTIESRTEEAEDTSHTLPCELNTECLEAINSPKPPVAEKVSDEAHDRSHFPCGLNGGCEESIIQAQPASEEGPAEKMEDSVNAIPCELNGECLEKSSRADPPLEEQISDKPVDETIFPCSLSDGCEESIIQAEPTSEERRPEKAEDQTFPCGLSGGCAEDIISADPTFIQKSLEQQASTILQTYEPSVSAEINAEIVIPYDNALVRANVPIFGRAYGKNFKEYRVEYGEGRNPAEWTIVQTSNIPQTKNVIPDEFLLSADLSIEGNLTTWDTGLKNYIYLPTHPKDHLINLKGTYTLRLVVTALDGQTVEDRVTLHVANVIPNAWGGRILSPDKQVIILVPEQAIMAPFRLILIQPTAHVPKMPEQGKELIGQVYEVKEANEQFTKNVVLEMKISEENIREHSLAQMAIYGYDVNKQEWNILQTYYQVNQQSLSAHVSQLHAYYAVMSSNHMGEGSQPSQLEPIVPTIHQVKMVPISRHYLVQDSFEENVGQWSNRDGKQGATLSLDTLSTFDGTKALKLVNSEAGGNFAVNIRSEPFDAKEFPVVEFDYRMEPGIKTSMYAKVSGRWYKIGLTDDATELKNKRVNIADLGLVPGIVTDDAWHTARFNLYDMLRNKTGHTIVDELIMADWDVLGYMKLQFGNNPKHATYYIDNFAIGRELSAGLQTNSDLILIDNFNQKKRKNNLRQHAYIFQDSDTGGGGMVHASFNPEDASGNGHSLALSYDVSPPHAYGGYVTTLPKLDLRGFHALTFSVKGLKAGQELFVGLRDSMGHEPKIPLSLYLPEKIGTTWKYVTIPLVAFSHEMDWRRIENLSFSFTHETHGKGTILLDNIQFHHHIDSLHVDSFELWRGKNLLGGPHRTFANGAAAISGTYTKGSPNGLFRLSYGGNIGKINAYASDLLTYAGWATRLGGIDCSRCANVMFRVRGGQGDENPNIYLDDGNFRWSVDLEDYISVTTEWQSVSIPLKAFSDHGVDLTHLEEFQVVFEWEQMSSTLYLDDVRFGRGITSEP